MSLRRNLYGRPRRPVGDTASLPSADNFRELQSRSADNVSEPIIRVNSVGCCEDIFSHTRTKSARFTSSTGSLYSSSVGDLAYSNTSSTGSIVSNSVSNSNSQNRLSSCSYFYYGSENDSQLEDDGALIIGNEVGSDGGGSVQQHDDGCVHGHNNNNDNDYKLLTREVIVSKTSSPKRSISMQSQMLGSFKKKSELIDMFSPKSKRKSDSPLKQSKERIEREYNIQEGFGVKVKWVKNKLHVAFVINGSRAEDCGLRVGDELIEINDIVIDQAYPEIVIEDMLDHSPETKIIMRDGSGASLTINKPKTKQQNLGINLEHGIIKTSCEGTNIFEEQGISIPQEQSIVSVNGKTMVGKSDKELLKYMEKALKKGACTLSLLSSDLSQELIQGLTLEDPQENMSPSQRRLANGRF